MTRNYRTIQEIAKTEQIGELHVWSAIRKHLVKSVVSPSGRHIVIYNEEWKRFAQSEEGIAFLDNAQDVAFKHYNA